MPHDITTRPTNRELSQDQFVTTTGKSVEWARENTRTVITTLGIVLALILVGVVAGIILHSRNQAASVAFGEAMETLQSPITVPGQPATPGVKGYASIADRAKAATPQFKAVADKYGSTKDGKNALYFEGLTFLQQGDAQSAETALKSVAGSFDSELASLGKLALADLYHQTARDPQAIDLYKQLTDKPTDAVPAGLAQLQLAELYTSEGKAADARRIYGQIKDKDAKSPAGVIAAKKLNPAAAPEPPH